MAFNPCGHFLKGPYSVPFGVYTVTAEGRRELLAFDWANSCGQAMPVATRRRPAAMASRVDWSGSSGTSYVHNVLVLRRSLDGGKTWLPMQIAVKAVPEAAMNPCPLSIGALAT
ncbi:MAG: exo-alpha-sialidase [Pirellulales bacterium]|nr:exo-alpha-sialidase [Pirellulales bacterium]